MKNNTIKYLAALLALALGLGLGLTGCSNDDEGSARTVTEGVVFRFQRKAVYKTGVDQIGSVKITLMRGNETIVLPSSKLRGDENSTETGAFSLPAGDYTLTAYTAYDTKHNWLFDMELDSKNEFTVSSNSVTTFVVPVKTREILNQNFIRNALMGICTEVFGEDDSQWPWDPDKYPYPDWEGLEFEFDDYGNPINITGINFNGIKDGVQTPWVKMTRLPEGTVSNLPTIMNLSFTDLPAFEQLADDLDIMPMLNVITCVNTGLTELPYNFTRLRQLHSIDVINGKLTSFPADISDMDLYSINLNGNEITEFDTSLVSQKHLDSFDLSNNPLTSIGEGVFAADGVLNELRLSNTKLTELPSVIREMTLLRSIDLSGCGLQRIPTEVKDNPYLKALWLDDNNLTSVSASDFSGIAHLSTLVLAGNKLGSIPRLNNANLAYLDVTDCGLTSAPDLSGLPALRQLLLGGNNFTTLPANYFAANPMMRILTLSNSPSLTSMPAGDLGLKSRISEAQEGFKLLEAENCPSLTWQTPAAWQCYDFTGRTADDIIGDQKAVKQTRRPDIDPGNPYDEYFGRVAVKRKGSPKVSFGK